MGVRPPVRAPGVFTAPSGQLIGNKFHATYHVDISASDDHRGRVPEAFDTPDLALAEVVRALRGERGLTQEGLAHEAGTTVRTVSRTENGGGDPSWVTIRRFAKALGVTTLEFVERVEQERAAR
jgi:DNA-binding XRE family transcriptional regulator